MSDTNSLPRRELEEYSLVHEYGLEFLLVTVLHIGSVRRTGEVRYRSVAGRYRVDRVAPGRVRLHKADGTVYDLTEWNCNCPDEKFKARQRLCKHRTAAEAVGLLPIAERTI